MPAEDAGRPPAELIATYRLQLHAGFTLDDAARLADYLSELGVSHLYCSPILQAAPGSTHGYDVVDPSRVNQELGGEAALYRLAQALNQNGLGLVLDIVPNHMAILPENPWWWDVLENGPASRFARYFDVDWDPPEARHSNVVLVPVLGDHYGRVLENRELCLDYAAGAFTIRYHDHTFPVDPRTQSSLLASAAERSGSEPLVFLAGAFERLPVELGQEAANRRAREAAVLRFWLNRLVEEEADVRRAVEQVVEETNRDFDALDVLLGLQNYRLTFWRISQRELGYRRFFDINSLIGLRVEDEQVFSESHARILEWLNAGIIQGVRIDHPDGLKDPEGYLWRLRSASPDAWLVVEKILEPGEKLPADWPVDGTSGYDFLYRVNALQVDPRGEAPLTDFYRRFTGDEEAYPELVRASKLKVMDLNLGSDVGRLTALFMQICERHRRYRDYARRELREALVETAACFPVYRTYLSLPAGGEQELAREPGEIHYHPEDVRYVEEAIAAAIERRPDIDPALFAFLRDLLLLRLPGRLETELALRFQQFTGPAMAKGVEDTAFYNNFRLVSLNEVGGSPADFSLSAEDFHRSCQETAEGRPRSMLATSTHDTKRSEDVRARLNVLSERPQAWSEAVESWSELAQRYRQNGRPDRKDEYLLYQTLVSAWPIDEARTAAYMLKACREAKRHTSWINPNRDYEEAVAAFVRSLYADGHLMERIADFAEQLTLPGWINALSQILIKLTSPGIPDLFQGTELWSLSLVDPDNRRPVDFEARRRLLAELDGLTAEEIWDRAAEGLPKLWVIRQGLRLRRQRPELFSPESGYRPLEVTGRHALGYCRGEAVVVVTPRFPAVGEEAWSETRVSLPEGSWRNLFTGDPVEGGERPLDELLARFPVCLLVQSSLTI